MSILVFQGRLGNLGKVENLMSILWVHIDHDLAAAGATGIGEMTLDLIDLGFRNDLPGISDVARLGTLLFVGRFAVVFSLGLTGEAILTGRGRRIGGVDLKAFNGRTEILHQGPQTVDDFARFAKRVGVLWTFEKLLFSGHESL